MIYDKASLVQIPSGYKSGTLYSVVPNTADGDFDVTRGSTATRVNKDGLIETVASDVPRLDYPLLDKVVQDCPTLLLEPTRQNKVYPNNSVTGYSTIGVSTTNNDAISPNGANEGAKVQATTSGTAVVFKGFTGTSGVTHNISAFVKAGTHNQIRLQEGFSASNIYVNLSTGTEVSSQNATNKKIEAYPNDWYRISFNFTSASTNLQFALYFSGSYTSGENIYLYGGQIEEGTYATSLIPTSGSAATRTEDFCYINSGLQNTLNTSEGTLFVDVEVPRVSSTGSFERIVLSDQNASTDRIIFDNYAGNWRALMLSTAGNVNKTIVSVTANQRIKVAIAYSSTQLRVSYDGNAATTTSGSYTPSTTLESFKFSNKDGGNKWQGKIYQTMVFNKALSDTELQTLTS